jgi:hypothetical protein
MLTFNYCTGKCNSRTWPGHGAVWFKSQLLGEQEAERDLEVTTILPYTESATAAAEVGESHSGGTPRNRRMRLASILARPPVLGSSI